jgi:hypothetical protein
MIFLKSIESFNINNLTYDIIVYIETGRAAPTGATLAILNAAITSPARTWKVYFNFYS